MSMKINSQNIIQLYIADIRRQFILFTDRMQGISNAIQSYGSAILSYSALDSPCLFEKYLQLLSFEVIYQAPAQALTIYLGHLKHFWQKMNLFIILKVVVVIQVGYTSMSTRSSGMQFKDTASMQQLIGSQMKRNWIMGTDSRYFSKGCNQFGLK